MAFWHMGIAQNATSLNQHTCAKTEMNLSKSLGSRFTQYQNNRFWKGRVGKGAIEIVQQLSIKKLIPPNLRHSTLMSLFLFMLTSRTIMLVKMVLPLSIKSFLIRPIYSIDVYGFS